MTNQRARVEAMREGSAATTLELFFDLVFVFSLTQVTALMADDLTVRGLLRGALVFAIVWWCWVGYSWLSNVVKADEGLAKLAILAAMVPMLLIGLAIPEAFEDLPGGVSGPVVFAVCYLLVRGIHLLLFLMISERDAGLRRQVLLFTPTMLGGTTFLVLAAQTSGTSQTLLWIAAVAADYGGTLIIGARGWRLPSARHFAERHGLIVIVALGESIVAIGVGVAELRLSWPVIIAGGLGLAVAASLWWSYFDVSALRAEHALARAEGTHRTSMARAAYTYLHLPLVFGVILLALGLKKVLEYVGDTGHHTLSDSLKWVPLVGLFGGAAMYLLAQVAFAWRTFRALKVGRVVLAVLILVLLPVAAAIPALASLILLAVLLVGLNAFETARFAQERDRIRHASHE